MPLVEVLSLLSHLECLPLSPSLVALEYFHQGTLITTVIEVILHIHVKGLVLLKEQLTVSAHSSNTNSSLPTGFGSGYGSSVVVVH